MKLRSFSLALLALVSTVAVSQATLTLSQADLAKLNAKPPVSVTSTITINVQDAPVVTPQPPVVVVPPQTGAAPVLKTVIAQNGATPLLPQDYSYVAKATRNYTADGGGDGNPAGIRVDVTGPWGGFQPSSLNGKSLSFKTSSQIVVSVKSSKAGIPYSMQCLMQGDLPIVDSSGNGVSVQFVSHTAGTYERYSFAKGLLMTNKGSDVSDQIYKCAVQLKTGQAGSFVLDNWGGQ